MACESRAPSLLPLLTPCIHAQTVPHVLILACQAVCAVHLSRLKWPAAQRAANVLGTCARRWYVRIWTGLGQARQGRAVFCGRRLSPAEAQAQGRESVAVAVRSKHLLATAFHPELTDDLRWCAITSTLSAEGCSVAAPGAARVPLVLAVLMLPSGVFALLSDCARMLDLNGFDSGAW